LCRAGKRFDKKQDFFSLFETFAFCVFNLTFLARARHITAAAAVVVVVVLVVVVVVVVVLLLSKKLQLESFPSSRVSLFCLERKISPSNFLFQLMSLLQ